MIEGDIISIDCGVINEGYYGDHAYTFKVGEVSSEIDQLLDATKNSLYVGMDAMIENNRIGDIGNAIESYIKLHGYGIVRELVGHGLGENLHEEPEVPNYGRKGVGKIIKNGLVLAIEPMINLGTQKINLDEDGWTIVTLDGLPSAHFEHNIALIDGKPEILSTFDYIYEALGIDSESMDFIDNSFDLVICNHVLEHIEDDVKALKEIYRVLNNNGIAILQVPINVNRKKTFEDSNITSQFDREKYFGQYDHVREYGIDFKDRVEEVGFEVDMINYTENFDEEFIIKYGLLKNDLIPIAKKSLSN